MNYGTLYHKKTKYSNINGEEIKDLLNLTFVIPPIFEYTVFKVTEEFIARPDLISLDNYGTTDYTDLICKINNLGNPYELNEGMFIIVPDPGSLDLFTFSEDDIDEKAELLKQQGTKPKTKQEKRAANEAVITDHRFKIDKERRIAIY